MRRTNAYHILSLVLACLGTAAWGCTTDLGREAAVAAGAAAVALLLNAAGFATLAVRHSRLEREALVRHLRHAAAAIRPDDARFNAPSVDADSFGAAVDGLIAASRAQAISLAGRNRELEVGLRAAVLEREHAQSTVATLADAVRSVGPDAGTPAGCGGGGGGAAGGGGGGRSWPADPAARRAFAAALRSRADARVARDVAREVARLKADFVALVSHELRTPLASIRAYAEMLIDGEAADEQSRREFFGILHTEAGRLEQSIENVLTLARLEAGLLTPARRPTSLNDVVARAADAVGPLAAAKRIDVAVTLASAAGGGDRVVADPDMVRQAVASLLWHAVKYTPDAGRVTVVTAVDPAGRRVSCRVTDGGAGIDPKDLPYVFDKFYGGADDHDRRTGPGTGLGLALARQVIEGGHGGRMHVRSAPGEGCCLGFDLEQAGRDAAGEPARGEAGRGGETR